MRNHRRVHTGVGPRDGHTAKRRAHCQKTLNITLNTVMYHIMISYLCVYRSIWYLEQSTGSGRCTQTLIAITYHRHTSQMYVFCSMWYLEQTIGSWRWRTQTLVAITYHIHIFRINPTHIYVFAELGARNNRQVHRGVGPRGGQTVKTPCIQSYTICVPHKTYVLWYLCLEGWTGS